MLHGSVKLEGIAPAGSIVGIFNRAGKMIARTLADGDGNWLIPAKSLPVGTHHLRAIVTSDSGQTICRSEECRVEVVEPGECEIVAEHAERETDPESRERYCNLVFAMHAGQRFDAALTRQVVEGAGKTWDDLEADLQTLAECEE